MKISKLKNSNLSRRRFLKTTGSIWLGGILGENLSRAIAASNTTHLPFENGERPLVQYPQKRELIQLTARPPQLETPFDVFNQSPITPNDAFFVRYHLSGIPTSIDLNTYQISVEGKVKKTLSLSIQDLKTQFSPIELTAVLQCSGNGRGFFKPRVGGGQLGNGAMGNARWKGIPLRDVLKKAGIDGSAKQVTFNGLDRPLLDATPDFVKALDLEHAMNGEVMLAYSMNGEDIPVLNGFPVRLVVPGYYGTYWVKHVTKITVLDETFNGFWMSTAYRVPDNSCACIKPGTTPDRTIPIGRLNVRSFITNLKNGDRLKAGQDFVVKGIAFDGGSGVKEVSVSYDDGKTWHSASLGKDLGKYSFREWNINMSIKRKGRYEIKVKATSHSGESQPLEPRWNSVGYMRNVVESIRIQIV